MEPQVEIYCKKENKRKDCSCLWLILAVIVIAITFFAGALVAALTGLIETLGIGAIITLLIALGVLAIVDIIALICCRKTDKKKKCCCC